MRGYPERLSAIPTRICARPPANEKIFAGFSEASRFSRKKVLARRTESAPETIKGDKMIEKLAATFVACVVLVCSMVTSDAFVHQSMHRAPQSPIAGQQTRWESRKGESGDRSKSEDTRKAQLARIETTALKSKARTPWVPWAMDLEGNTRRVGVVLHLSHEEGEKVKT